MNVRGGPHGLYRAVDKGGPAQHERVPQCVRRRGTAIPTGIEVAAAHGTQRTEACHDDVASSADAMGGGRGSVAAVGPAIAKRETVDFLGNSY